MQYLPLAFYMHDDLYLYTRALDNNSSMLTCDLGLFSLANRPTKTHTITCYGAQFLTMKRILRIKTDPN